MLFLLKGGSSLMRFHWCGSGARIAAMAEIINLRMARKSRARAQAQASAAANRALHGRTKAEKARDKADQDRVNRALDGAKRDDIPTA
jgi:hypothetical protein